MKKFVIVILLSLVCVLTASLWESAFIRQSSTQQLEAFQKRLHKEEKRVDEMLAMLKPGQLPCRKSWQKKQIVLLGFQNRELFYWSDERIGTPDLYEQLNAGKSFLKLNNAYYDIRKRSIGDQEYYALIFLKDDYPISNNYIKNRVNGTLGVDIENADKIILQDSFASSGTTVCNKDGESLFQVASDVQYIDRLPNYFVLILYLLALYLFFIAYALALKNSSSLRKQIFWVIVFVFFFWMLRMAMIYFQAPYSLYSLSIFRTNYNHWNLSLPVGDLFLTIFCLIHFFYITLRNIRIKYYEARLVRWRYLFLIVFVLGVFVYMNFIHYSINALIDNTKISLNIARIVNINFSSVIAFVTSVMGIMGLLILIDGSIRYFYNLFSVKELIVALALIWGGAIVSCTVFPLTLSPGECVFALALYYLLIINLYLVKGEARKSIFITAIIMVSVYITFLSKNREAHREEIVRSEYANDLIQERDTIFEKKLLELEQEIKNDKTLKSLIKKGNDSLVSDYIFKTLTDLTGYNYGYKVMIFDREERLCMRKDSVVPRDRNPEYQIDSRGVPVRNTSFFNIDEFDGTITYIGHYGYPVGVNELSLYIRFDSRQEAVRNGYQQILSMMPFDEYSIVYPYSYAKYKNGKLMMSNGSYNYYRDLSQFSSNYSHVQTIVKEGYSHLLVPVGTDGLFVISLDRSYFAPYNLNVLYAVLVCLLLSSYGIFFRFNREIWGLNNNSIKKRIKNNIIGLVIVLILIMSSMSIISTSAGFERRQSYEVVRLSQYINRELEANDCVEAAKCPEIRQTLSKIADVVQVDVNIYDMKGALVSTSMPTIFLKGFDGMLINPEAKSHILKENATSFVQQEKIGELNYMATYMPLELKNGEKYILSIPYFTKSDELNRDILLLVVISINVAMVVIVLAFFLSGIVAERVTKPLQMVNEKLRLMRIGGKNEKITYAQDDEVGALVKEYNNLVDMLEDNIKKLSKAERESAWREMARQIAHEIKNPLTPMKLNIQFLQRALHANHIDESKKRFEDISAVLIEQIDHMASIATAFSDFAKVSVTNNELFNFSEMVEGCAKLFENNVEQIRYYVEPDLFVHGDKDQINRVLVNLLKNAEQSVPEGKEGFLMITLRKKGKRVLFSLKDNGVGIPDEIKDRIAEPNFTTKSGGMGLGLAISYRIIEHMEGKIWFESKEGEGSIFYISLKLVEI